MGQGLSCSEAMSFNVGLGKHFPQVTGLGAASGSREGNTHSFFLCPKILFHYFKQFKKCLGWMSNQDLGSIRTEDTSSKVRLPSATTICWEKVVHFLTAFCYQPITIVLDLKKSLQMKERENVFFLLYGWILLLDFTLQKIFLNGNTKTSYGYGPLCLKKQNEVLLEVLG